MRAAPFPPVAMPASLSPLQARGQAVVQGGDLLLSAAAAAALAAAADEEAGVVPSGVVFGNAFDATMHWITGPLLGVKRPEWQADAGTVGMHALNHVAFGVATAAVTRLVSTAAAGAQG